MIKTLFKGAIEGDSTPPELHELKEIKLGNKLAELVPNSPKTHYSTLVDYYEVKETECPLCSKPLRSSVGGSKVCMYCKASIVPLMDKQAYIFTSDKELLATFLENLTGDDYSLAEEEVEGYDESDDDNDDSDPYYRESCPHDRRDAFEDLEAIVNGFSTDLEYQTFEYYEQAVNHGIAELGDIVKTMAKEIGSLKRELESMKNKLLQSPKAKPHDTAKAELLKHLKDLTKLLGE